MNQPSSIFFNKPQAHEAFIDANEFYGVWGRGTGKTSGPLSRRSFRNVKEMPGSSGISIGETYQQLLTRTLPSRIEGWAKLGLQKDKHYFIGRKPPRAWKWPEPIEAPVSYDHYIAFCNGSGIHLVSQDRKGSSNGINSDWIEGDEAKYLNYQQFLDETLPTMRANRPKFKHLPYHWSLTFTTSMPTAADAKWILEKREEMDQEQIQLMLLINAQILLLQEDFKAAKTETNRKAIAREIAALEAQLTKMRFNCVYYSEASTLDNLAVLGKEYISRMKRIMPDYIFDTEILNKRPDTIEGGFYPMLDIDIHTYTSYNNSFLDSLDYDFTKSKNIDSRMDEDCVKNQPLRIAVDWGSKINCLSVGQFFSSINTFKFLKCMHVLHPELLDHLAKKFLDYYQHHTCKEVYFAYDHTGNTKLANSNRTYAEQFADILKKGGWKVIMRSKGKAAPTHQEKYLLWYKLLQRQDPRMPMVMFNKNNTKELQISMLQAPAIEGPNGIQKNKSSERNENVPQEQATHYSDTADILIQDLFASLIKKRAAFVPMPQ